MPGIYDHRGIRFSYPDNWTIDEEDPAGGERSITVSSPDGAFWSLTVFPQAVDLDRLLRGAVDALRTEYTDLDEEAASETICGQELCGFDANFYCLDLTTTALIRGFRTSAAAYLLYCQAEDRDFERLAPVFLAMTTSLLSC